MQANMPKEVGDSGLMEDTDSDEPPSGLDDGDDKDNENLNADSNLNDENESDTEDDGHTEHSDDISLAEGSDDDDLIDLDEVLPEGLIDYDGSDTEETPEDEEEWTGFGRGQKRKRAGEQKGCGRRKKLRSLPTFASYEEYAKMIDEGPEDDI